MEIHYFQRYHAKENVATANTMLLLSRFYHSSSSAFFQLLKSKFFEEMLEPELVFTLQEKAINSVPDATIKQESFKIVVETKMFDWFGLDQLINHLNSFSDEKYKVLLTLSSEYMNEKIKGEFNSKLAEFNQNVDNPIIHVNMTFEELANEISDLISDNDYVMKEIVEDYFDYCYSDGLITISDKYKYLRSQLASATFDFNFNNNIYYDSISRGFRPHKYLGLYKEKSVRAIGEITMIITAEKINGEYIFNSETENKEVTQKQKAEIFNAIEDAKKYGYILENNRFFFVDKFYKTDYKKITKNAPMGSRIFDLTKVLEIDELPSVNQIAELLKDKEWE